MDLLERVIVCCKAYATKQRACVDHDEEDDDSLHMGRTKPMTMVFNTIIIISPLFAMLKRIGLVEAIAQPRG